MSRNQWPPPPPLTNKYKITVTLDELKRAFTEWDRRYRENPEEFESEVVHLLKGTPYTYGDACAPYFLKLIRMVKQSNE